MRTLIAVLLLAFCGPARSADAPAEKAAALVHAGNYEDAIKVYKQALVNNPEDAGLHLSLGLTYQAVSKFEHAIASIRKAVEFSPKFTDAYYSLALLHEAVALNSDDPQERKKNLESAGDSWAKVLLFEKDVKKVKVARKHKADILEQLSE